MGDLTGKHFDYIYIICCYTGRIGENEGYKNKEKGEEWIPPYLINRHLDFLCNYKYLRDNDKTTLFIVSHRGPESKTTSLIREYLKLRKLSRNITCELLVNKNWGMLVGSLWDTWKWIETNSITCGYIMAMEQDWLFNHWPHREKHIRDNGLIYSGMFSTIGSIGTDDYYKSAVEQGYKTEGGWDSEKRRWTDGGLYFLKYKALKEIEDKIGIFTEAPLNEEITLENDGYHNHGIKHGELGFPTRLWKAGFKFAAYIDTAYIEDGCFHNPSQWGGGYEPYKGINNFYSDLDHPSAGNWKI